MKKTAVKKFIHKKPAQKPKVQKKETHRTANKHSPSNSRPITERSKRKPSLYAYIFTICFLCGIILMGILLLEQDIVQTYTQLQTIQAQRQAAQQQITTWQKIVQKYSNYKDGYLHLAILEYEVGDIQAAQVNDTKALAIDPNFTQARELLGKLE